MAGTETPADRLRTAAGRVREGWTRYQLRDASGDRCALGAICDVRRRTVGSFGVMTMLFADPIADAAVTALHAYLRAAADPPLPVIPDLRVDSIAWWNDDPHTNGEEVAVTMEKAAAWIEERA
jgi:hypothetical protein